MVIGSLCHGGCVVVLNNWKYKKRGSVKNLKNTLAIPVDDGLIVNIPVNNLYRVQIIY